MQLHGAWADALAEARRAGSAAARRERAGGRRRRATGRARSIACGGSSPRPRRPTARRAGCGCEPQPGLALLRLARGDADGGRGRDPPAAGRGAGARRARAGCCPAAVEIMLAAGDRRRRARRAASSRRSPSATRAECSARWRRTRAGRSISPTGDARAGAGRPARGVRRPGGSWRRPTRRRGRGSWSAWPARALGDEDTAALELEGAREVFERLGAAPDLARLDALAAPDAGSLRAHGARARGAAAWWPPATATGRSPPAGHQRAHRRAPPAEHLRQARRVVANRGGRVRARARPGLTPPRGRK